ncbi:hypothetical protein LshimejAT787_1103880 [Lyophyllum shimeji]|uniref:Uncharacterized protein n=1 Tax=Lyophyllum shimeji TaxID=47721 RepID=A0A9P3PUQ5_LYOSH|nr:hypothetical protein LshimejAT787_1103880 [Lyophyllum shimeji]
MDVCRELEGRRLQGELTKLSKPAPCGGKQVAQSDGAHVGDFIYPTVSQRTQASEVFDHVRGHRNPGQAERHEIVEAENKPFDCGGWDIGVR